MNSGERIEQLRQELRLEMARETDKVDQNRDKGGRERPAPEKPLRQDKRDAPDVPARPPQKRDFKDRKY